MSERRYVKPGEMLAMDHRCLHTDTERGAMFWLMSDPPRPNERRGSVAIVHIRGELDHHLSWGGDSYEGILKRYQDAITGQDAADQYERQHRWDDDYQPCAVEPPSHVAFCIDSPGGVVAGLDECIKAIRKLRRECGIPLISYANEMAASAAFALTCACDESYCPPSAIIGSIGVISTMISQDKKNKKDGYDVRLITSGARKADGHVHAPITDDAEAVERGRVEQIAESFFALASKARSRGGRKPLSVDRVKSYQANIYLGREALQKRLVDGVRSFDELVSSLSIPAPATPKTAGGNETDRREGGLPYHVTTGFRLTESEATRTTRGTKMDLDKLIAKTLAAMAVERDPTKLAELGTSYAAYAKAKKDMYDDEDEEDDDEAKKAKKAKKAEEEKKAKHAEEEEKKAKKAEEEKKASAAIATATASITDASGAALALVEGVTGLKGPAALGAVMAKLARLDQIVEDTNAMKADAAAKETAALVERAGKYVPSHLVKAVAAQGLEGLRAFVAEAEKGQPMVNTEEGMLLRPKAVQPGTEASLPKETLALIDQAVAACGLRDPKAFRETLVQSHLKAHNERLNAAMNGAGRI